MALRNFASSTLGALGLRSQASVLFALNRSTDMLGAATSRAFSSVVDGYKYAKSHEWAKIEGDVATVGISDHAQAELGDVVFVELPDVGKEVKQGETFGVVESVKAASDVYAPLSGEVVEVNEALKDEPALVNKDPHSGGWIMKVKLSDKGEASNLLDAAAYQKEFS